MDVPHEACRRLDDAGEQTGAVLGQIAAFMEEMQLKVYKEYPVWLSLTIILQEGAPDRYGVARMRELALLLQSSHTPRKVVLEINVLEDFTDF